MGSIFDETPNEFFEKKVIEYEPLLWYAARRFEIPGILPREDLYQEGLIVLDELLTETIVNHPDSGDFTRSFKTRLFHRMSEKLKPHKTQKRDWKKELRDLLFKDERDNDGTVSIFNRIPQSTFPSPDHLSELLALQQYLDALESDLKQASLTGQLWGNSADDALEVLHLVIDPDLKIPKEISSIYERFPTALTKPLLSELTGWDRNKVRRALRRLRKHARELAPKFGIEVPPEVK